MTINDALHRAAAISNAAPIDSVFCGRMQA
jgi:hypothetical protein